MPAAGLQLRAFASVWLALACLIPGAAHARALRVTSADDAGPGSLREAIEQANADRRVTVIRFAQRAVSIELQSGLEYTGRQPLRIDGLGATLSGAMGGSFPLLTSNGGANLQLRSLTLMGAGAQGLLASLPANARGNRSLQLIGVNAIQNAGCGVELDDSVGSPASIRLMIVGGTFSANGSGLCLDERGAGNVLATLVRASFNGNAEDGAVLSEAGPGSALVTLNSVHADANGFVDPLQPGGGFSISELDAGHLRVVVARGSFSANAADGIAIDESGDGSAMARLARVSAINNLVSGVIAAESDAGDLVASTIAVIATGNGDDGIALGELGAGNFRGMVVSSRATGNGGNGIQAVQEAPGTGALLASRSAVSDNAEGELEFDGISLRLR